MQPIRLPKMCIRNIGITAQKLQIPVIRFERSFPPPNPLLHWFDDYHSAIRFLEEKNIHNLLALTGVNTILKLKPYWLNHRCIFRIMKRMSRWRLSKKTDSRMKISCSMRMNVTRLHFPAPIPGAIITKESGESGGFTGKIDTALALGIPVLVIRRPPLPYFAHATIYGKHGLRKQIETLSPGFFDLKTGYTSGSCATAAVKAALTALLSGIPVEDITISLPNDEPVTINIVRTVFEPNGSVTCTVLKDAGDDPDVTNGAEICANIAINSTHGGIRFLQGIGVGKVTLPGLGLEIGDPAINATPRKMIERETQETLEKLSDDLHTGIDITISVPRGEEIAKRTFNPKLGIVGGISIIGTSGIVKPYSNEAFIHSIRREAQVAKALG
jgi:cobalt-precorrin-5B (C1)-methyltransferase